MTKDGIQIEVNVNFLSPGMILQGDGYNEQAELVIEKGKPITEEQIEQLNKSGTKIITYTRDRIRSKQEFENPMIQSGHIEKAYNVMNDIESAIRQKATTLPTSGIKEVTQDFMHDIKDNEDSLLNLLDVVKSDDYTYANAVNTSTMAIALGYLLGLEEDKVKILGMGGLMHDIGKTVIPSEVLNKPDKLTTDEWKILKKHPVYGYNILKEKGDFHIQTLNVVLLHHENYNGGGYPFGFNNEKINAFPQVISVTDSFDAITSPRSYRAPKHFSEAFSFIMEQSGLKYHPRISQMFLKEMVRKMTVEPIYPLDSYVLLSTGEIGYVVGHRQSKYSLRPIVNIFFNPNKKEQFLRFTQQVDLENDYRRSVIKRIINPNYIEKFNQFLNREGI